MTEFYRNGQELQRLQLQENKIDSLKELLASYTSLEDTVAVAIGGSSASASRDSSSDIDIYVFLKKDLPAAVRKNDIVAPRSDRYEVGGDYFGPGDEFTLRGSELECDVMYWTTGWFEDLIKGVWLKHQGWNGYTTAFLYTLHNFIIVYDTDGWLDSLRTMSNAEYPDELRNNIISRNLMLMRDKPFSSYLEQIKKAAGRNDTVSVNHRIAAFLASYFDVLFAINRVFHPGEKKQVAFALKNCRLLPMHFKEDFDELFKPGISFEEQINLLNRMFDELKDILQKD